MARNEQSVSISGFRGLNQRKLLGRNPEQTTNLENVIVRDGIIRGRKGITTFDNIGTASVTPTIIGLFPFYRSKTEVASLLRVTSSRVELWNDSGNAWDNITGPTIANDTTKFPQATTLDDTLFFTTGSIVRVRKYSGSGDTSLAGGTPPYCKAIEGYVGFLFLGNISSDGITFSPLDIQYSDDPDVDWTLCDGNTLTLDESPGDIRVLKVHDRLLLAGKSDAIIAIRWTGGQTRFVQEKIFGKGVIAPLSWQQCGEIGHIFLGSDLNLYITNGVQTKPLPFNVQKALQETMSITKAPICVAAVDEDKTTYHLFYSTSASDTWLAGELAYNYQTGEFYKNSYTVPKVIRATAYKQSNTVKNKILFSGDDDLVYEAELGTDDNGNKISRIYDTDYLNYGIEGDKWLTRVRLSFIGLKRDCHVRVSCSKDFEADLPNEADSLEYPRTYDLRNDGEVIYEIPSPLYGNWFNVRVEMFHLGSTNVCELREIVPYFVPMTRTSMETSKVEAPTTGQGV